MESAIFENINSFVSRAGWEVTLEALVREYSDSTWLQGGGTTGCMNSITWLFGKNWINNVDNVAGGKYAAKKSSQVLRDGRDIGDNKGHDMTPEEVAAYKARSKSKYV